MAITYDKLMSLAVKDMPFSYTDRDSMLYAVAVGMGRDATDLKQLDYVFEQNPLKTVASQACVVARTQLLLGSGIDRAKVLHGEQSLTLHRPLPAAGSLLADSRVTAAYDKGAGKGALIYVETLARDANSGDALFTLVNCTFARGDGGIGGPGGPAPQPHVMPERQPEHTATTVTRPEQALLYRLTGDRNPLHADPVLAARVGYKAPILHGLCTYGIACKDVLARVCDYDHTALTGFDVRFTSPVYPGETIATDMWVDGDVVSFRCRVVERDVIVLNHGRATIRRH